MSKRHDMKLSRIIEDALYSSTYFYNPESPGTGCNHYLCNVLDDLTTRGEISGYQYSVAKHRIQRELEGEYTLIGYLNKKRFNSEWRAPTHGEIQEFFFDLIERIKKEGDPIIPWFSVSRR